MGVKRETGKEGLALSYVERCAPEHKGGLSAAKPGRPDGSPVRVIVVVVQDPPSLGGPRARGGGGPAQSLII